MAAVATLVEGVRTGFRGLADLLAPPCCLSCRAPVATSGTLCADCWGQLPAIGDNRCVRCAVPLPEAHATESHCLSCLKDPPPFDAARAPFLYDGPARTLVLRLKNGGESRAPHLARDMARVAPEWIAPGRILVPVPLHRLRLARRGYNQALLLARALARSGGAELAPDWLQRVKNTRSTQGMRRAARLANIAGAFRLRPDAQSRIRGADITLIDDVMTTGATLSACARLLRRAGAASVAVLVYARVAGDHSTAYLQAQSGQEPHGQG